MEIHNQSQTFPGSIRTWLRHLSSSFGHLTLTPLLGAGDGGNGGGSGGSVGSYNIMGNVTMGQGSTLNMSSTAETRYDFERH